MKQRGRIRSILLTLAMVMTMLSGFTVHAEEGVPGGVSGGVLGAGAAKAIPEIRLSVGNGQTTPSYKAGEKVTLTIKVENQGKVAAQNVRIVPIIDQEKDWPFVLKNMNEELLLGEIKETQFTEAKWEWTVRKDVETKAYKTVFRISYDDGSQEYKEDKSIHIKTTAEDKKEEKPEQPNPDPQKPEEQKPPVPAPEKPVTPEPPLSDGGDIYNGEPMVSGGGSSEPANPSVPRVIVTGFRTEPGVVNAGSNFKLIVQVKNTSTSTAVSNMLFDFQAPSAGTEAAAEAPAFLPASGASSVYLDSIPAGGTREISIDLNARADLVQKPYSISLSMKYENRNAEQFEGNSSLAIPVQQAARFEFSEIEVLPGSIEVGEEANLTCSLYNTGRTKLYNVKVKFSGEGISAKEVFVGNVDSGSTGMIDGMILGEKEMMPGSKCKMIVTYEDEAGKESVKEETFELEVVPAMDDMDMMMEPPVEEKGFPVMPVVVVVLVIVVIGVVLFILRRKKKKQALAEEEELVNEVDRFTEDE